MKNYKKRKWYNAFTCKPNVGDNYTYLIMTDMGYMFQAYYCQDGWHVMKVMNDKCYFPLYENQECIIQWMIIWKG